MLQCHKCGNTIQNNTGVHRFMKTSTSGNGKGFFRTVNLCRRCDKQVSHQDRQEVVKKGMLVLLALAAAIGGGVYWLICR